MINQCFMLMYAKPKSLLYSAVKMNFFVKWFVTWNSKPEPFKLMFYGYKISFVLYLGCWLVYSNHK